MKLVSGFAKTTREAISQQPLVPIQMTSRRSRKVTGFKDARLVWNWKILKEIHRCTLSLVCVTVVCASSIIGLYLLCKIGIATDDFSLTSMMSDYPDNKIIGNLNDFNFEGIAKSKNRVPSRRGWERTGTSAFMALELLKYHDCQSKWWYRHDLESSAWCFVYLILASDLSTWRNGTHEEIFSAKLTFCQFTSAYRAHPVWVDYMVFAYTWVRRWMALDGLRNELVETILDKSEQIAKLTQEDSKVTDAVHIKDAIDEASKLAGCAGLDSEVFETGNEWIDVTLLHRTDALIVNIAFILHT